MNALKRSFAVVSLLISPLLFACEGCDRSQTQSTLKLPFQDNFDRPTIGKQWWTNRPGRWKIKYDAKTKQGKLCVEQARNNHLFLKARHPEEIIVEVDAWGLEKDGDLKVEVFSDGRYAKTGYVLVQGGWHNALSIIDRMDEHRKDRRVKRNKDGTPMVKKDKKYHWKIVVKKTGTGSKQVSWYVDGALYLTYKDKMGLGGKQHAHFAFGNWIANACYDNLRIYAPKQASAAAPVAPAAAPTPTPVRAVKPAPLRAQEPTPTPAPTKTRVDPTPKKISPAARRPRIIMAPKLMRNPIQAIRPRTYRLLNTAKSSRFTRTIRFPIKRKPKQR